MDEILLGDWETAKIGGEDKDLSKYNRSLKINREIDSLDEEQLHSPNNIIKDVIDNLDRDVTNKNGMNSIDFNTQLNAFEIPAMTVLQMLSTLGLGGSECSLLALRIQRNKVSTDRKGRTEKVDVIKGEREHEEGKKSSLFGNVTGFMKGNKHEGIGK